MAKQPIHEEEIFQTAWEIKNSQARHSYLKRACGDDAALFHRVVELLSVASEESSFPCPPPRVL